MGDNTVDTYVDQAMQYPGGNAVNVAVLAHRLGADTGYLGCLGTDAAGDLLFNALSTEGVDLSHCRRIEGANARALIAHRDGDRRFLGSSPGVRGRYALADVDLAYVAGFDIVHSSIYSEIEPDLARIRAVAKRLSFDFSDKWSDAVFARVLPQIDIAFLSCPGRTDAECAAVLHGCARSGVRLAVATRGADGAMALADGVLHRQGIASAPVIDTLGAGDGFIAAFLTARQAGGGVPAALAHAARFAARVCGWQGAFGHGAPWADDNGVLASRPVAAGAVTHGPN
nr:PfkB family carbohydrate kinase [Limobrevibacterium gyesilva]